MSYALTQGLFAQSFEASFMYLMGWMVTFYYAANSFFLLNAL